MLNTVKAIYENGVLKPLEKIDLKERQKVEIILKFKKSAVERTKGMFRADPELIRFIAEDDALLWEK
ncbi:MAG: antitoxin family protein [Nitrospiraceae bacterium]|nr:antitoxin family protein [Nitrospiraceae bacterium]MDA8340262.1 antitoxin family protein [Nitrospiraceae bacterium]